MFKKAVIFIFCAALLAALSGCVALVAGAAGSAGTAMWLSGKLTQEVQSPYGRAVEAAKSALKSLKLEINKETRAQTLTQLKSKYTNGKEVWIDVRKITDNLSRLEVRVGIVSDRAAAAQILKKIVQYL